MRLPSINDFSPKIIGDVREPLRIVAQNSGNFEAIVEGWAAAFFDGKDNKRARTNVSATLGNIGLFDRKTATLTAAGEHVLAAGSASDAAARFVLHIIENANGTLLIDAISTLNKREERITKDSLKRALKSLGVEGLAAATTDHTTLRNWMVEAGVLGPKPSYIPNAKVLKLLTGITTDERSDFLDLPLSQQIFLKVLRRRVEVAPTGPVPAKQITDECLQDYPHHFDDDQLSAKVTKPLEEAGWIELAGRSGRRAGGKAGSVVATDKLLEIPVAEIVPDFDAVVPPDLRQKIHTPKSEIQLLLESDSKHDRGLGLELLALNMLMDLNLQPRSFRQRSKDTAYAELDLTAEGMNLIFSRWNWQCKNVSARVPLGDVAKEVGLAIYSKSHVVAMVTTSDFSREALAYAKEITSATHLQFLFVNGEMVDAYLQRGQSVLIDHVRANAASVMAIKRAQPIDPEQRNG